MEHRDRWFYEYLEEIHQRKLEMIRSSSSARIDNSPPMTLQISKSKASSFLNLRNREIREIYRKNQVILGALHEITERKVREMQKKPEVILPIGPRTLNLPFRKKEIEKIIQENEFLLNRISNKKPTLSMRKFDMDFEQAQKYKKNVAKSHFYNHPQKLDKEKSLPKLEDSKKSHKSDVLKPELSDSISKTQKKQRSYSNDKEKIMSDLENCRNDDSINESENVEKSQLILEIQAKINGFHGEKLPNSKNEMEKEEILSKEKEGVEKEEAKNNSKEIEEKKKKDEKGVLKVLENAEKAENRRSVLSDKDNKTSETVKGMSADMIERHESELTNRLTIINERKKQEPDLIEASSLKKTKIKNSTKKHEKQNLSSEETKAQTFSQPIAAEKLESTRYKTKKSETPLEPEKLNSKTTRTKNDSLEKNREDSEVLKKGSESSSKLRGNHSESLKYETVKSSKQQEYPSKSRLEDKNSMKSSKKSKLDKEKSSKISTNSLDVLDFSSKEGEFNKNKDPSTFSGPKEEKSTPDQENLVILSKIEEQGEEIEKATPISMQISLKEPLESTQKLENNAKKRLEPSTHASLHHKSTVKIERTGTLGNSLKKSSSFHEIYNKPMQFHPILKEKTAR